LSKFDRKKSYLLLKKAQALRIEKPPSWCTFFASLPEQNKYEYKVPKTRSKLDMAAKRAGDGIQGERDSNCVSPDNTVAFGMVSVLNCTYQII
jgi:hypothetical protein